MVVIIIIIVAIVVVVDDVDRVGLLKLNKQFLNVDISTFSIIQDYLLFVKHKYGSAASNEKRFVYRTPEVHVYVLAVARSGLALNSSDMESHKLPHRITKQTTNDQQTDKCTENNNMKHTNTNCWQLRQPMLKYSICKWNYMPTYSEYYRIIIKIKQFEFIYLICIFCSLGTFESQRRK